MNVQSAMHRRWSATRGEWGVRFVLGALLFMSAALSIVRRWYTRWGATDAEIRSGLQGDDLVPFASSVRTKAITIHASVEQVFPWLLQLGQQKAGFYSFEFIENAICHCNIHNADIIVSEWQDTKPGDLVHLFPPGQGGPPPYVVAQVEPNRAFVIGHMNEDKSRWADVWQFGLRPVDANTTRLIHRVRTAGFGNVWDALDPAYFFMERGMVLGIKARAERLAASTSPISA